MLPLLKFQEFILSFFFCLPVCLKHSKHGIFINLFIKSSIKISQVNETHLPLFQLSVNFSELEQIVEAKGFVENLIKDHPDKYRWLSFSCVRDHTLLKHANSNRLVSSRHAKLSSNKIVRHLIITTLNSECSAWSWYDVNGAARMLTNSNFYQPECRYAQCRGTLKTKFPWYIYRTRSSASDVQTLFLLKLVTARAIQRVLWFEHT